MSLVSLEKLVVNLRKKKQDASKLRLKTEKQLKELRSTERRSLSGLSSLDKKIESEREDFSGASDILTQKNAQLESIQRLVETAESRLNQEKEALIEAQQQVEFAENNDEKQNAEGRIKSITAHIEDLEFEINSRKKTAKKITEQVAHISNTKSKITTKIKKQTQSKPSLRDAMISSHKKAGKFEKELEKYIKQEEIAKNSLDKAVAKLEELHLKKKAAKRPARKTAPKRKAAKRPARKTAPKRKAAKRPARKTAPKRKAAKK
ncbi:MAG: hypothetical protein OEM21_06110 [Nitrosopumilus sp.]|nr:hypothetical protein [Nitrosopumilus sp.]